MGIELGRGKSLTQIARRGRFASTTTTSPLLQRRTWFWLIGAALVTLLLWQSYASRERLFASHTNQRAGSVSKDVYNSTLGFGAIFMPVMPHRSDQIDTATLLGHLTGISITVTPGIYPENINRVAIPLGDYKPNEPGVLGAWRAHLNIMREVVKRNLSTALVFEADADWDIRIKEQVSLMAESIPGSGQKDAPFGLDWEMIWLGVSGHGYPADGDPGLKAAWKDESLPERDIMDGYIKSMLQASKLEGDQWRVLARAWFPVCTGAYAVTYAGAYRILYELGYNELYGPTDLELGRLGRDKKLDAYVVIPPLVSQYRTGSARDSEINEYASKFEGNEKGQSGSHVVRSARKALKSLYRMTEEMSPIARLA
ncbi:MAG: hypothetical protein Q9227_005938 [Pyrenula ochraceoflavens]